VSALTQQTRISDSQAYCLGMEAYASEEFVPCPFPPNSRRAMMWHEGRADAEYAEQFCEHGESLEIENAIQNLQKMPNSSY